jgi:hypothetical protein
LVFPAKFLVYICVCASSAASFSHWSSLLLATPQISIQQVLWFLVLLL